MDYSHNATPVPADHDRSEAVDDEGRACAPSLSRSGLSTAHLGTVGPNTGPGSSSPSPMLGVVHEGMLTPRTQRKQAGFARSEDDSDSSSTASMNASFEDAQSLVRRERSAAALAYSPSGAPMFRRSGSSSSIKLSSSWCETGRLGGSFDQLEEEAGTGPRVKWGTREVFEIAGLDTWSEEEKQGAWWGNRDFGSFVASELKRRRELGVVSNRALHAESECWVDPSPIQLSAADRRWWDVDDSSSGPSWGLWEGVFGPASTFDSEVGDSGSDRNGANSPSDIEEPEGAGVFESLFGSMEDLFTVPAADQRHRNRRSTF
mmetsp:Transcript_17565/g.45810  ORF Transcript_17565/g.45810 Transcript_17565/m.45810 type:complete len:318 (-) Transcript_17565:116-1069(-)